MGLWVLLHLVIGAVGTALARRYAEHRDLMDHPGERRSHAVSTARGGGIAIVLALMVATVCLAMREPQQSALLVSFGTGLVLVAGIGWVDDHRPLPAWWRLAVHGLAAGVFALAFAHAQGGNLVVALAAFVLLIVLTNVWNFMDGINGIAASQAMIVGGALAIWLGGAWGLMAAALAAASLGFLPHNFPRARIFMGDVGSGATGFALAAMLVVAGSQRGAHSILWLLPVSAFLIDAGLTLLRRMLRGEQWWTAHVQHAYQIQSRRSGHVKVTTAYAVWTLAACVLAAWARGASMSFITSITVAWYTSGALLWGAAQYLGSHERAGRTEGNTE